MHNNDYQHISNVLHIKHQCNFKKRKKNTNFAVQLNIDDNCEILKHARCLGIGKKMDAVMDINVARVKVSKAIAQGAETLNACRHMLWAMTI